MSTIQVKLMRKMIYKKPYMFKTVRPFKVLKAAQYSVQQEGYIEEGISLSSDWKGYEVYRQFFKNFKTQFRFNAQFTEIFPGEKINFDCDAGNQKKIEDQNVENENANLHCFLSKICIMMKTLLSSHFSGKCNQSLKSIVFWI